MPEESSFEYAALEADMKRLAEQIKIQRERPAGETKTERRAREGGDPRFPELSGMRRKDAAAAPRRRAARPMIRKARCPIMRKMLPRR